MFSLIDGEDTSHSQCVPDCGLLSRPVTFRQAQVVDPHRATRHRPTAQRKIIVAGSGSLDPRSLLYSRPQIGRQTHTVHRQRHRSTKPPQGAEDFSPWRKPWDRGSPKIAPAPRGAEDFSPGRKPWERSAESRCQETLRVSHAGGADACLVASAVSRSESFTPPHASPFGKSQPPKNGVCASRRVGFDSPARGGRL